MCGVDREGEACWRRRRSVAHCASTPASTDQSECDAKRFFGGNQLGLGGRFDVAPGFRTTTTTRNTVGIGRAKAAIQSKSARDEATSSRRASRSEPSGSQYHARTTHGANRTHPKHSHGVTRRARTGHACRTARRPLRHRSIKHASQNRRMGPQPGTAQPPPTLRPASHNGARHGVAAA
jgi:hypothetical protein